MRQERSQGPGPDSEHGGDSAGAAPGKRPLTASVQRKASGGASPPSDPSEVSRLAEGGLGSGGELPHRAQLESCFGVDLSSVRAHTGDRAAQAGRAIGADAYAMGDDVAFVSPSPSPSLVAHEVAHVIQQRGGAGPASGVGEVGDRFEREADDAAAAVQSGAPSDLASRYSPAGAAAAVQRRAVQRYESSEHAATGDGMQYPFALSPITLPNKAWATRGELIAFGDFYDSYEAIADAPRQETEALVGIIRWEGIWRLAMRQKQLAPQGGGALRDPAERRGLETSAEPDDTGVWGGKAELEGTDQLLTWDDPAWSTQIGGGTLRAKALEIHSQFAPAWQFFQVNVPLTTFSPDCALTLQQLKLNLGRRRFRNANNTLGTPETGPLADTTDPRVADPGHLRGDFFDLASNNVSHFAITNWKTWEKYHQKVCKLVADKPGDQTVRDRAMIEDSWGCHFLTDMFSAGHLIDKQDLMASATQMMIDMSQLHHRSGPGADRHAVLTDMLREGLQMAFHDDAVYAAWQAGCRVALDHGLARLDEVELMLTIPRGSFDSTPAFGKAPTVVENLVQTIMGMPWRDKEDANTPGGGLRESFGPKPTGPGGGDYHLGIGNMAAITVHNALNAIGVTAFNDAGQSWRMQGDGHLTTASQAMAQRAVDESTRQATSGEFKPEEVRKFTPRRAMIDPAWVADYYAGRQRKGFKIDPGSMATLDGILAQAKGTPFELLDEAHGTVSARMREICLAIMKVEFTAAPDEFGQLEGHNNVSATETGINISFLKHFLIENLPRMVPAAYAITSAGDLPTRALEAYQPRDGRGTKLPTGANDFVWAKDESRVDFAVNVTGCKPGEHVLGIMVYDQDGDIDFHPSGQQVDEQAPRDGDEVYGLGGEVDRADPDAMKAAQFHVPIRIPEHVDAEGGATYVTTSFPLIGATDHEEHYIRVFADAACTMAIGRSSPRGSSEPSNPRPGQAPRVTGNDADRPTYYVAGGVLRNAFNWHGNNVTFRLIDGAPADAPAGVPLRVWIKQFDRHSGYDYDAGGREMVDSKPDLRRDDTLIGGPTAVDIDRQPCGRISDPYTFTAIDNDNDTYIAVYADADCTQPLGRSEVQGTDRGAVSTLPDVPATAADTWWSDDMLRLTVEPAGVRKVWVKFYDRSMGYDYDDRGALISGARITDDPIGDVIEVPVKEGRGTAIGGGIRHNAYGIVYADAACTRPVRRSLVRGP